MPAQVATEVILGALYHRLLLPSGPLDAAYANFVVDTASPAPPPPGRT
jgi:hypothetical protein